MAKKQWRWRSRAEWSGWVRQWHESGLSGSQFAKRHGLSPRSLLRWSRRLKEEGEQGVEVEEPMSFAEVRVRDTTTPPATAGVIEVVARSGWVVRVVGRVDVEQLRAVLEAVD